MGLRHPANIAVLTFRHAGDLGDIIYSLPVLRSLCNGQPSVLLIEAAPYTRVRLTPDKWCGIDHLIRAQPYIADVRAHNGEAPTFNLNDFRQRMFTLLKMHGVHKEKHLTHWMCEVHGVDPNVLLTQWLEVEPIKVARVVFARSGAGRDPRYVYQNPAFPWHRVWAKYGKEAVFVGTAHEHELFCATCGDVPRVETETLLEAAQVIAGCELFVGNQTCTHAIAEGLKKRIILEVWPGGPNCLVYRPGVTHGLDQHCELPDL